CVRNDSTSPASKTSPASHLKRKLRILSRRSGVPRSPITKNGRKLRARPKEIVASSCGASGASTETATAKANGWRKDFSSGVHKRQMNRANRNHRVHDGWKMLTLKSLPLISTRKQAWIN